MAIPVLPPNADSASPTSPPENVAAWALKPKDRPLVVYPAPYTKPPASHVVIRVSDVAVNPIDWILQDDDVLKLEYATVFGQDVAGIITEVAEDVTSLKIGTRVIAFCARKPNVELPSGATGGFQKYVVVQAGAVCELPDKIPAHVGVVLPLGMSTAAAGLYQQGTLSLPFPDPEGKPNSLGRTVLIWGGSSSVGSCAIQLAVASGAEVVTTASSWNFEYCKKLGAAEVFDYHWRDVEDKIVTWLKGKTICGAFHTVGADGAVESCARIVDKSKGKAIVVSVQPIDKTKIPESVRTRPIGAFTIFSDEVGPQIWEGFLSKALRAGTVIPKPDPMIVGEELRSVQLGLDTQKRGVSARKVVVTNI